MADITDPANLQSTPLSDAPSEPLPAPSDSLIVPPLSVDAPQATSTSSVNPFTDVRVPLDVVPQKKAPAASPVASSPLPDVSMLPSEPIPEPVVSPATQTMTDVEKSTQSPSNGDLSDLKPKKKGMGMIMMVSLMLLLVALPVGVYFISSNGLGMFDTRNRAAGTTTPLYGPPSEPGACVGGNGYTCTDCHQNTVCNKNMTITCEQFRTLAGCGNGSVPPFGNNQPGGPCGSGTVPGTGNCAPDKACDPGTNSCQSVITGGNCANNTGNCYVTNGIGVVASGPNKGQICDRAGHWTTCVVGSVCKNSDCIPAGGTPKPTTKPPPPTNPPTKPPTFTPTPLPGQCTDIKAYKGTTLLDSNGLKALKPGDVITFAVAGSRNPTKAHFRINGAAWVETTKKNAAGEFVTEDFAIPTDTVSDVC